MLQITLSSFKSINRQASLGLIALYMLCTSRMTSYGQDCAIFDVTADVICEQDSFFVVLSFEFENTSDSFRVAGNGNNYGTYDYSNNPLTLGPLPADNTPYEFVIIDQNNPNCSDFIDVGLVDCDTMGMCSIYDIVVDFDECTSDSTYRITVDFIYENTPDSFFTLWDQNGDLVGFYAYSDLPITIDHYPQGSGMTNSLLVCANAHINCCNDAIWPNPMCGANEDCSIRDLVADAIDCTEDSFYIKIDFIHEHVSDSFILRGNGRVYGTFSYDDLPLILGPFSYDVNINEFVVIDAENEDCREDIAFENDCQGGQCMLSELEVETGAMITDSTFELTFNFQYENVSDSFDAWSGQQYLGRYAYADLPITILEFPTRDLEYELLLVCEAELNACCTAIEFMYTNCEECKISEVTAQVAECDGDSVFVIVDFNITDGSNAGFEIVGNGLHYGAFDYDDLPIEISFVASEGDFIDLIIRDLLHPHCIQYTYIESLTCDSECELSEVNVDFQECTSDSTYNFLLNMEYQGTGELGFDLWANGMPFGFYLYDDLPVLIEDFPSDGQGNDVILLCDNDNMDCCITIEVPVPNCISGLQETERHRAMKIRNTPGQWEIQVPEKGSISIFDMTGRRILEPVAVTDRFQVNNLVSGMYIVTWSGAWGSVSQTAVYISQ